MKLVEGPLKRAIVREHRVKLLFFLSSLIFVGWIVLKVDNMLVSLILGIATFYLLTPVVDFLERRGLSRLTATTLPFVIVIGVQIFLLSLLVPVLWEQVKHLQLNSDRYLETLNNGVEQMQSRLFLMLGDFHELNLRESLVPHVIEWGTQFFQRLPVYVSQSFTVILLAPLFAYFMLLDGRDFIRRWLSLVPNPLFEMALNLNYQIGSQIGGFIRARMIQSLLIGLFIWLGLLIIDFPFALILGIIAGILNIIPYVGPVIGALPAFFICLANGGGSTELLLLLFIYVLSQVLDTVILVPFLVARIVNLHPITVLLSIIAGAQLMGILGMIICIPVVSALKVTLYSVYRHMTDFRT